MPFRETALRLFLLVVLLAGVTGCKVQVDKSSNGEGDMFQVSARPLRRPTARGPWLSCSAPVQGAPAVLRDRATRSVPVLDRYRADGASASGDPYDPRLFREVVYLPVMSAVAKVVAGPGPGAGGEMAGGLATRAPAGG